MFRGKFILVIFVLIIVVLRSANCINCYSCNSKQEKYCLDPFPYNYTAPSLKIVDCSNEVTTRQFVSYFSSLMSALGVSINTNAKNSLNRLSEQSQLSACQKVEIIDSNHERVVIRDCAILSEIVCDTLKNDSRSDTSITFCEICDSDHCNSSHRVNIAWNLLFVTILTYRVIL